MVGIDAGREFRELHHIDQFALCGISPALKLTFQELRKQAIRVAVLLHDDFKKPQGVVPPFSSAVANDLKGWLQAQVRREEQIRAVKLFYANSTGHRGLVWWPYLKGKDGVLLARTDPAIWRRPGQRPIPMQDDAVGPERKRRTYASTPGTREEFHRPERAPTPPPSPAWSSHSSSSIGPENAAAYSVEDLFALAKIAGDSTGHRIAVACLPEYQGRIVTIRLDASRRLTYRVETIDFRGRPVAHENISAEEVTFERLAQEKLVFLGQFIGATDAKLYRFAWTMDFDSGQSSDDSDSRV